jgi:glycine dehydrogenase subunit 2
MHEKLIFEHSRPGRSAEAQYPLRESSTAIPDALRRRSAPLLPEVSELQAVRHFHAPLAAQFLHRHAHSTRSARAR